MSSELRDETEGPSQSTLLYDEWANAQPFLKCLAAHSTVYCRTENLLENFLWNRPHLMPPLVQYSTSSLTGDRKVEQDGAGVSEARLLRPRPALQRAVQLRLPGEP